MIRFAIIATALAGCYKPAVGDCEYLCAADNSCPNDLTCDPVMNRCREPALMGQACGAPPPGDGTPEGVNLCGWTYQPLNFNPCDLPADPAELTIDTNGLVLDSDAGTFGGNPVPHIQTSDGMTIFHFSGIDVGPGLEILTAGARAIVIAVSGDVNFAGIVAVDALNVAAGPGGGSSQAAGTRCNDGNGHDATSQGGGGGAGFGQVGAPGGTGNAGNAGTAGGTEMGFEPLRGGCNGGDGGNAGTGQSIVGNGGGGGGAIQFSARGTLVINGGQIRASGGGGRLGRDPAPSGGGGGGGSGGTIVLEGTSVTISNALLCANGGGGGGGGTVAGAMGSDGELGTCSNLPAAGGSAGGAPGGHGGGLVVPANGGNATEGAGGGGGGAGRIHFIGHPTLSVDTSVVTPVQL